MLRPSAWVLPREGGAGAGSRNRPHPHPDELAELIRIRHS
jgi:hypothetical protein